MTPDDTRREYLRAMQAEKRRRRMRLADDVSLLWESEATIRHQMDEMKRMDEPAAEVEAHYGDLRPSPQRLTATLSVEVTDTRDIRPALKRYARLAEALRLRLSDGTEVAPDVLGDHGSDDAATAVTYLAFPLPNGAPLDGARLDVQHPALHSEQPVPDAVTAAPA